MLQQRGWRLHTAIFGVSTYKTGSAYGVPTWRMACCLSTPIHPSVLCLLMLGMEFCKLYIPFVIYLPVTVLQTAGPGRQGEKRNLLSISLVHISVNSTMP